MPITREEFKGSSLAGSIASFLRDHPSLAFTAEELMFELGAFGAIATLDEVLRALDSLSQRGWIDVRERRGSVYYMYHYSLGFRPPN